MRRQLDDQLDIIRLHVSIVSRAIAKKLSAFFALVNDNIPFFRIGDRRHCAKKSAAFVGTVTGIYIHMK